MFTILSLSLSLISQSPSPIAPTVLPSTPSTNINAQPQLEFSGTPGARYSGLCITSSNGEEKKFDGVVPSKISLDLSIQKCRFSKEGKEAKVKVRLFQDKDTLYQSELNGPTVGVEFVIPMGKKKH